MAEELWQALGHAETLAYEPWPAFDPALAQEDTVEMPVQINGKLRSKITVPADADAKAHRSRRPRRRTNRRAARRQADRQSDRRAGPDGELCDQRLRRSARTRTHPGTNLPSQNVVALVLGGGRGTRLYPLTNYRSKPAVPLAGKYRLIDIPLSNCINSEHQPDLRADAVSIGQPASPHPRHVSLRSISAAASSKSWPPSKRSTKPTTTGLVSGHGRRRPQESALHARSRNRTTC